MQQNQKKWSSSSLTQFCPWARNVVLNYIFLQITSSERIKRTGITTAAAATTTELTSISQGN